MDVRISGLLQQRIGDLLEANGKRSVLSILKCCRYSEESYLHRIEISQQKGRSHFLWMCLNKRWIEGEICSLTKSLWIFFKLQIDSAMFPVHICACFNGRCYCWRWWDSFTIFSSTWSQWPAGCMGTSGQERSTEWTTPVPSSPAPEVYLLLTVVF